MGAGGTRVDLLGGLLLGVITIAFLFLGGVEASVRMGLHLGLACVLGVALALPDRRLGIATTSVHRAVGVGLVLCSAMVLGLLPLPGRPGWRAAEDGMAALAVLGLVISASSVAAVWGAQRRRLATLATGLLWFSLALIALAGAHAAAGLQDALGLIRTSHTLQGRFFGPLVNPNHVGIVLLLALPLAFDRALDQRQRAPLAAAVSVGSLALMWAAGARSAAMVAVGVAAWVLWRRRGVRAVGWAALLAVIPLWITARGSSAVDSVGGRAQIWGDSARLLLSRPILGVGAGGYGAALEPWRTDLWRASISHAHNDLLEWVVETGLVGLVALGLAVWIGRRAIAWPVDSEHQLLLGGALAAAVPALVDFPLAIPAVAMLWAAVLGAIAGDQGRSSGGDPARVRVVLVLLIGVNVLGATASWHRDRVDRATEMVRARGRDTARAAAASQTLQDWASWRGWDALHQAWVAEGIGNQTDAVARAREVVGFAPNDDDRLRPAALVLARQRAPDALEVALQAQKMGPSDYRNRIALGRVYASRGESAEAAEAYAQAFERDAPYSVVKEAWDAFPVGLYWVDRLESMPRYGVYLAGMLTWRGAADEALLIYDAAARVDPERWGDVPARSMALLEVGRREEALASAEARTLSAPDDPQSWWVLGNVRFGLGEFAGAVEAWRRVEEEMPGVQVLIVRALGRQDLELAVAEVKRIELRGALAPALVGELARAYARAGDRRGCERTADRVVAVGERERLKAVCVAVH